MCLRTDNTQKNCIHEHVQTDRNKSSWRHEDETGRKEWETARLSWLRRGPPSLSPLCEQNRPLWVCACPQVSSLCWKSWLMFHSCVCVVSVEKGTTIYQSSFKKYVARGSISLIMCMHINLYERVCRRLCVWVLYVCMRCAAVVDVLMLSARLCRADV